MDSPDAYRSGPDPVVAMKYALGRVPLQQPAEGTVVKFVVEISGRSYTYAALWIAQSWFLTGNAAVIGGNKQSWSQFVQLLRKAHDVEVSVVWEEV